MTALAHEFSCKLPVTTQRAFAALTQAEDLKAWFAEHVEVEARPGGAYRFWGKHTYGAPTRAEATQKILRIAAPSELAFSWALHGQLSEVSLTIEPNPEGGASAIVKGKHAFPIAPNINRAKEMVDDLWRLHCGNLKAYLKGSGDLLLPDFTDAAPAIRLSLLIDAPPERVFRALLDPALLNKWVASAAVVEPRVGGRYSYGWSYEHGGARVEGGPSRILEMIENEKLVIDWPDWRGDASVPKQQITWLLESAGKQTRVTMIHSGFVRAVDISDYPFGWGSFAKRLKLTAEGEEILPFTATCG
jgi:uncharacterized protein YndB with AHSA1/START domain